MVEIADSLGLNLDIVDSEKQKELREKKIDYTIIIGYDAAFENEQEYSLKGSYSNYECTYVEVDQKYAN